MLIGNGKYHGGFPIRYTDVSDGALKVAVCTAQHPMETLGAMWAALKHKIGGSKWFEEFDRTKLEIGTTAPKLVCADGDIVTQTPAAFEIHADALEVFVP